MKLIVLLSYRNLYYFQKYVPVNVYEVNQELGVWNCLFLLAQGWGIDHQERKNCKSPGVCLQVKLNHALLNDATKFNTCTGLLLVLSLNQEAPTF